MDKKRFFLKGLGFVLLFFLLFAALCIASAFSPVREMVAQLTDTGDFLDQGPSHEIVTKIEKVQGSSGATKLLIGDSVCNHMFAEYEGMNPDYIVAAGNRGVGMSGQYVLTRLFLDTHPGAEAVYLVITTNTLITGYETQFGYQYSVTPFLRTDTLGLMDEESLSDMRSVYGGFVTDKKAALLMEDSPVLKKLYLNLLNKYKPAGIKAEIPDTVVRNIIRIHDLCDERGAKLYLLPGPVADSTERRELEKTLEEKYGETKLAEVYPDFYGNMLYYPAEYFSDGVHPDRNSGMIDDMIREMQAVNHCLEDYTIDEQ